MDPGPDTTANTSSSGQCPHPRVQALSGGREGWAHSVEGTPATCRLGNPQGWIWLPPFPEVFGQCRVQGSSVILSRSRKGCPRADAKGARGRRLPPLGVLAQPLPPGLCVCLCVHVSRVTDCVLTRVHVLMCACVLCLCVHLGKHARASLACVAMSARIRVSVHLCGHRCVHLQRGARGQGDRFSGSLPSPHLRGQDTRMPALRWERWRGAGCKQAGIGYMGQALCSAETVAELCAWGGAQSGFLKN